MEIVKQYLENRIEQINKQLSDEEEMYFAAGIYGEKVLKNLKKELEQVLTLFNEENEKNDKLISDITSANADMQQELWAKKA